MNNRANSAASKETPAQGAFVGQTALVKKLPVAAQRDSVFNHSPFHTPHSAFAPKIDSKLRKTSADELSKPYTLGRNSNWTYCVKFCDCPRIPVRTSSPSRQAHTLLSPNKKSRTKLTGKLTRKIRSGWATQEKYSPGRRSRSCHRAWGRAADIAECVANAADWRTAPPAKALERIAAAKLLDCSELAPAELTPAELARAAAEFEKLDRAAFARLKAELVPLLLLVVPVLEVPVVEVPVLELLPLPEPLHMPEPVPVVDEPVEVVPVPVVVVPVVVPVVAVPVVAVPVVLASAEFASKLAVELPEPVVPELKAAASCRSCALVSVPPLSALSTAFNRAVSRRLCAAVKVPLCSNCCNAVAAVLSCCAAAAEVDVLEELVPELPDEVPFMQFTL